MTEDSSRLPRAIILGNGPSLKGFDFLRLEAFHAFGMNAAYRYWDRIAWYPQYYSCLDDVVGQSHAREIGGLIQRAELCGIRKFLLRENLIERLQDQGTDLARVVNFDELRRAEEILQTMTLSTGSHTAAWASVLGYKEIFLLGVDCNYVEIVPEARLVDKTELEIVAVPKANPNYFFSDYQQVGDKYNIPNPDREVHLESWREIARGLPAEVTMLNANLKSRLDAFDFCRFEQVETCQEVEIIPRETVLPHLGTDFDEEVDEPSFPRVLILDVTRRGDGSATGELKSMLFAGWPDDRILQVYEDSDLKLDGSLQWLRNQRFDLLETYPDARSVEYVIDEFDPQLVFYRPTPEGLALHVIAMELAKRTEIPLVVAIWDDWMSREDAKSTAQAKDIGWLLQNSASCIAISKAMAEAFEKRYACVFEVFANGIEVDEWRDVATRPEAETFSVRYSGSVAANMSRQSLFEIAQAVQNLSRDGIDIRFEITTSQHWAAAARSAFAEFPQTTILDENKSLSAYRQWLQEADCVVISYNFDSDSARYVRYSMPNKLPECLASGAATLCYGPDDFTAVSYLREQDCAYCVVDQSVDKLEQTILNIVEDEAHRKRVTERARYIAASNHDAKEIRSRFQERLKAMVNVGSEAREVIPRYADSRFRRLRQMTHWVWVAVTAQPVAYTGATLFTMMALFAPYLFEGLWSYRIWLWILATIVLFSGLVGVGIAVANSVLMRLLDEIDRRDDAVRRGIRDAVLPVRSRITSIEHRIDSDESAGAESDIPALREEIAELRRRVDVLLDD